MQQIPVAGRIVKLDRYRKDFELANVKAPAGKRKGTVARALTVEYHVVPNGRRWDVERDDAFFGSFAFDVNTAIGLAIVVAQRDLHNGLDVMVCVQEPDGHCRRVWP